MAELIICGWTNDVLPDLEFWRVFSHSHYTPDMEQHQCHTGSESATLATSRSRLVDIVLLRRQSRGNLAFSCRLVATGTERQA